MHNLVELQHSCVSQNLFPEPRLFWEAFSLTQGFIDLGQFIGAEDDGGDDEDNADFDGGVGDSAVEVEKLLCCFLFSSSRVEPPSVADAANRIEMHMPLPWLFVNMRMKR